MSLFSELKRRNVLRVAAAYVVVAWVIVQVTVTLRELFPATPLWIGQSLIVLLALGVVPILLFAWFYELTPDGFKRDAEVGDDRSYADATGRRLIYVTVAAVVAGVALFAWTREADEPAAEAPETVQSIAANSVAVLPFVNMSADPDNEYFSDGLSETLLHLLAQVRDLKVAARTSSFAFKDKKNTDIRDIGAALGVAHVLEGSVQRAADRIRITAQLVRTHDGFHVWSENYDRELTDIFAIQDEIAAEVGVQLLASVLDPAEATRRRSASTSNFSAYDLYLRARAEVRSASFEALTKAEGHLRAALEEDPEFLDAKAELAELMMSQADTGMRPYSEGIPALTALANEVLASDPEHPKARSLLLSIQIMVAANAGDFSVWTKNEPELRAVVAAAPDNIEVRINLAFLISRFGDPEESVAILKDALETDRLNPRIYEILSEAFEKLQDYDAARDTLLTAVKIQPDAPNPWLFLGDIAIRLGDGALAIDSFLQAQSADALDHEIPGRAAAFLYSIGLVGEAREFHERVSDIGSGSESEQNLDLLRAIALGDLDEARQRARDVIAGDPPERGSAWHTARRILLFTSVERGTEKEDIAFLEERLPDFTNLEKIDVSGQVATLRSNHIDVLAAVKTDGQLRDFRKRVNTHYQQINVQIEDFPRIALDWYIVIDDAASAKSVALDSVFSRPVTTMKMWRLRFARPFMAEFMSGPQMQEALLRWEQEEERIRSDVRNYLAERS